MKWIVLEDQPGPETFIAVIGIPDCKKHSAEQQPCTYFRNKRDAIERAIFLKRKLKVHEIRVFTPEGE